MTSNVGTTGTIAVDDNTVVSLDIPASKRTIRRIQVARTSGDSATYDITVSTDADVDPSSGTSPDLTLQIAISGNNDPGNDPIVLDNGGDGYPIQHNTDHQIHVLVENAGGTIGSEYTVRIYY